MDTGTAWVSSPLAQVCGFTWNGASCVASCPQDPWEFSQQSKPSPTLLSNHMCNAHPSWLVFWTGNGSTRLRMRDKKSCTTRAPATRVQIADPCTRQ